MLIEPSDNKEKIETLTRQIKKLIDAGGVSNVRAAYKLYKRNKDRALNGVDFIAAALAAADNSYGPVVVHKAYKAAMRAAQRGTVEVKRPPMPREWVRLAWERQGRRCHCCQAEMPVFDKDVTGDHVIALNQATEENRNLLHRPENIRALRRSCNSSKNGRSIYAESKRSGRLLTEILE